MVVLRLVPGSHMSQSILMSAAASEFSSCFSAAASGGVVCHGVGWRGEWPAGVRAWRPGGHRRHGMRRAREAVAEGCTAVHSHRGHRIGQAREAVKEGCTASAWPSWRAARPTWRARSQRGGQCGERAACMDTRRGERVAIAVTGCG